MSEFFVGYLPKAPPGIARILRRTVFGLFLAVSLAAISLVRNQHPFPDAVFEYGQIRNFEGVLQTRPYPMLLVPRPGVTETVAAYSTYLLVGEGKHAVDPLPAELSDSHVKLRGTLIYRDNQTAIEVVMGSIIASGSADKTLSSLIAEGPAALTGEIVDTKCYLGVMNPGEGKVHRDCATRCLSGGIPPSFAVADSSGERDVYLLETLDGDPVPLPWLEQRAGALLTLRGTLYRDGDRRIFRISLEENNPAFRAALRRQENPTTAQ
jgi:hypothetical protein